MRCLSLSMLPSFNFLCLCLGVLSSPQAVLILENAHTRDTFVLFSTYTQRLCHIQPWCMVTVHQSQQWKATDEAQHFSTCNKYFSSISRLAEVLSSPDASMATLNGFFSSRWEVPQLIWYPPFSPCLEKVYDAMISWQFPLKTHWLSQPSTLGSSRVLRNLLTRVGSLCYLHNNLFKNCKVFSGQQTT